MFVLYDKNKGKIKFPVGVTPLDIFISSIEKERVTKRVDGKHGNIDYGFSYNSRSIELNILLESRDTRDYRRLRDEVYAFFQANDEMYVIESYQPGKIYLITVDDQFIPERVPNNRRFAEATIYCTKKNLPFAESIRNTTWIDQHGIPDDWHGMGVEPGSNQSYRFPVIGEGGSSWYFLSPGLMVENDSSTGHFSIYNYGNVEIHPFEQSLKITIENIVGSNEFLEIENTTNGTKFRVNEGVSHKVIIDGPNITINGLQALRKTDKTFIELDIGLNEFKLKGADSMFISFEFPFYYK